MLFKRAAQYIGSTVVTLFLKYLTTIVFHKLWSLFETNVSELFRAHLRC